MYYVPVYSDELYHHGVKGQKWGVRKKYNETWKKEPEGCSIRLQVKNMKTNGLIHPIKKLKIKHQINKNIKEYGKFEKDTHKAYGRLKDYKLEIDKQKYGDRKHHYVHRKEGFEVDKKVINGLHSYEMSRSVAKMRVKTALSTIGHLSLAAAGLYGASYYGSKLGGM